MEIRSKTTLRAAGFSCASREKLHLEKRRVNHWTARSSQKLKYTWKENILKDENETRFKLYGSHITFLSSHDIHDSLMIKLDTELTSVYI